MTAERAGVLVLAAIELIVFLVAGTVLCFEFSKLGRLHPSVKERGSMAAAGLVVFCAMLLGSDGSPSKLKTLVQLHAQPLTTTSQEDPPGMVKAPTRGGQV